MTRFLTPSASALRPGLALAIALWGLLGSPESAATVSIRVLLLRGVPFAEVSSRGRLRVYSLGEARLLHETDGESPVGLRAQGGRLILSDRGERPLPAGGVRLRAVEESIRLNGAAYRGAIDAAASREGLRVVNVVRLEDYLRGVVGREVPARWPQAALQAQAVAARTFALLLRGRAERAASGPAFSHLTA
ncbi:MAG: SpoIID/LytB domain-containing protein, partial [Nitrospinota bacterium]